MPKARGNGDGSVRERKTAAGTAYWEARGRITGPDGQPHHLSRTAPTRRGALDALGKALADIRGGNPPAAERETLAAYAARWLSDVAEPRLDPRTYKRYRELLDLHILPTLGKRPLAALTPAEVQALLTRKRRDGLAPATVIRMRAVLRTALAEAVKWGLAPRNVAALVTPPKAVRAEIHPLLPAEGLTFLRAIAADRLAALYALAIGLGLRQGELLGLHWGDIDTKRSVLIVHTNLQRYDGAYHLDATKTPASTATVRLPAELLDDLKTHRARQAAERLRAGSEWADWGLVFTTETGRPLHHSTVTHQFWRHLERAGLPRMRFHDLRHTCASLHLHRGAELHEVSKLLRHSSLAITSDIYGHLYPERRQALADNMGAWLRESRADVGLDVGTVTETAIQSDPPAPPKRRNQAVSEA